MNWLDIIGILTIVVIVIGSIVLEVIGIYDKEYEFAGGCFVVSLFLCALVVLMFFFVCDKSAGVTQGYITSVDKNFFGTTALYIKTTETTEEQHCIEDSKLSEIAKENIGKKVRISYGTRVGIYSTGACDNAPVDVIEIINEENNVKGN